MVKHIVLWNLKAELCDRRKNMFRLRGIAAGHAWYMAPYNIAGVA